MSKILPVIHHLNTVTTLREAYIAFECGADGVFLISHDGQCMDLLEIGPVLKARHPGSLIGINMLSKNCVDAYDMASEFGFDAVWADHVGVSSIGTTELGNQLADRMRGRKLMVFGSVAFKYQPVDPYPAVAARVACDMGMIPTTSGVATGRAPTIEKIATMSQAVGGSLAVASGMSCENVADFAPFLSHILVSTNVSRDDYHLDAAKLTKFVAIAGHSLAVGKVLEP